MKTTILIITMLASLSSHGALGGSGEEGTRQEDIAGLASLSSHGALGGSGEEDTRQEDRDSNLTDSGLKLYAGIEGCVCGGTGKSTNKKDGFFRN